MRLSYEFIHQEGKFFLCMVQKHVGEGRMDGWMDRWMDGLMDGWIDRSIDR